MQQSRLPDVSDPPIFMLKVKTGMEQHLVMAMMRKVLDYKQRDQDLHIKSVFCTGTQGIVALAAASFIAGVSNLDDYEPMHCLCRLHICRGDSRASSEDRCARY